MFRRTRITALMAVSLLATTAGAFAQNNARQGRMTVSRQDRDFARKLGMGNTAEIHFGKMALEKAQSPAVRQFAQQMIRDHSNAGYQFTAIAKPKGVVVPMRLDAKHRKLSQQMRRMSTQNFERKYMVEQVKDHVATLELLRREVRLGRDPQFKAFAQKMIPPVEGHLRMARDIINGNTGNMAM